jgi:hypothetical protein
VPHSSIESVDALALLDPLDCDAAGGGGEAMAFMGRGGAL